MERGRLKTFRACLVLATVSLMTTLLLPSSEVRAQSEATPENSKYEAAVRRINSAVGCRIERMQTDTGSRVSRIFVGGFITNIKEMMDSILYVIRRDRVERVDFASATLDDSVCVALSRCPSLTDVTLESARITDRGFKAICSMKNLQRLDILALVTDQGATDIKNLKHLKSLTLKEFIGGALSEAGLQVLSSLTDLEDLTLVLDGKVADHLAETVSRLKKLKRLTLSGSRITDEGLKSLSRLSLLEELSIINCEHKISKIGVSHLSTLPKLKSLDLTRCIIDDDGIAPLETVVSLEELKLGGVPISDKGLSVLYGLPRLRKLDIFNTEIKGDHAKLSRCRSLRDLTLSPSQFRSMINEILCLDSIDHVFLLPNDPTEVQTLESEPCVIHLRKRFPKAFVEILRAVPATTLDQ